MNANTSIRVHPCLFAAGLTAVLFAVGSPEIPFRKHTIDIGRNESCTVADLNRDGQLDIISGENWFEAPKWTRRKFRDLPFWQNYIDNFSDHVLDVNGDGFPDVISVAWNARRIAWWENPGAAGLARGVEWRMHPIDSGFPVEFSFLVDLDNDGQARELLPQFGNPKAPLAWYEVSKGQWIKHQVSDRSYGHGIGAGDVNGDGRTDIVTPKGWFEAPADPRRGVWTFHPDFDLGDAGFIHVLDVNRDGVPDLVTGLAHNYGIFWLEQQRGSNKWTKHLIDDAWSQPHALTLADLNGDGRPKSSPASASTPTTAATPASASRSASTGMNTSRTATTGTGSATSSTTVARPAAACRSPWSTLTAMATPISWSPANPASISLKTSPVTAANRI